MNDENLKSGRGRKPGVPNRTTAQMREMIVQIVNENLEGVAEALEEVKKKDKVQIQIAE